MSELMEAIRKQLGVMTAAEAATAFSRATSGATAATTGLTGVLSGIPGVLHAASVFRWWPYGTVIECNGMQAMVIATDDIDYLHVIVLHNDEPGVKGGYRGTIPATSVGSWRPVE